MRLCFPWLGRLPGMPPPPIFTHMKTHRKPSRQQRRAPKHKAYIAEYKAKAEETFQSQITTTRLKLWGMQHDEDATEFLSLLAVVIGAPCECGSRQYGHGPAWVRQLHGALRSVAAMCINGYRWDISQAAAIDRAIEIAAETRHDLDVATFIDAWKEANGLAMSIERHTFKADQIAA